MKKILILSIFLMFSLLLAGCGRSAETLDDSQRGRDFRRPDFGQPQKPADVTGVVESITGNEVTILKIERPQGGNPNASSTETGAGDIGANRSAQPAAIGSTNRAGAPGGGFGMRMPGGPGGRGERQGGTTSADDQAEMLENLKKMSTGKVVVTIPVGIQMLKDDAASQGKPEMAEATLTDIKQNKMVRIWLDDAAAERKIANFVMITK